MKGGAIMTNANARSIVKMCLMHKKLVDACKQALRCFRDIRNPKTIAIEELLEELIDEARVST